MPAFKVVDYGRTPDDMEKSRGVPMFKPVSVTWSDPRSWTLQKPTGVRLSSEERKSHFLYAVTWHAARSKMRSRLIYIGLTTKPAVRFQVHSTDKFAGKGQTRSLSLGRLEFKTKTKNNHDLSSYLEQLEHIFIWSLGDYLVNRKKQQTVPGQGVNGGQAWHISNKGHRFDGQMPAEIVFPWVIAKAHETRGRKIIARLPVQAKAQDLA